MNPPHHQSMMPLNLKSLRTRFTLRFLRALKNINHQENGPTSSDDLCMVAQRYNKVKVAADASLASAVGPKRVWSRAMLMRIRTRSRHRYAVARRRKRQRGVGRVEQLRRLVPGGEEMEDMQSLLDETVHYIKCLATQVKVMRSIVDICSTTP